ncbi:MAG TPA: hypothetical protein VJJ52_07965 [Candidatus Nanoarchaeia archaeon]|nr:hypothetical protein [Candidatus Nanoarchaeia archaeon]
MEKTNYNKFGKYHGIVPGLYARPIYVKRQQSTENKNGFLGANQSTLETKIEEIFFI